VVIDDRYRPPRDFLSVLPGVVKDPAPRPIRPAMALQKVLLVDDEPDIRRIAHISLQRVGQLQVVLAASGEQALGLAALERPDVVLLDVMMPELDGPTTFQRLRADPATAAIPVIFMTAKAQKHEVEAFKALGAAGVIPKPFDPMTLAAEVRKILTCWIS
jgi:CheY-like chemotaxis protein